MLAETVQLLPDVPAGSRAGTTSDRWLFPLFALFAGSIDALLLIGWRQIDPINLAWLRKDPAVYQAGWEFLRRQPWRFPPTWIANLDYPFGISASYLDVIPIVAVPMHLFANILPENFQYLGAYIALCLVLQAYFALKLLSRFSSDRLLVCLGALFFLDAPILLNRLFGHFSLCSQWLILATLYYYFRPVERHNIARYIAPFAVLAFIASGITPYIAVMVVLIGLAAILRISIERFPSPETPLNSVPCSERLQRPGAVRHEAWRTLSQSPIVWALVLVTSTLLAFLLFGFVTPGSNTIMHGVGYGMFSMNLLAPLNASMGSLYFKALPVQSAQAFEGYNYLGMGIILLGLLALARRPGLLAKIWTPPQRPLLYVCVLLTFLALSVRITMGETVVVTVPVPQTIFNLLAIFRGSGRFFWPVYYLLFLGAIVGATSTIRPPWARCAVLAGACLLQHLDQLPMREALAHETSITAFNPLTGPAWKTLAGSAQHLIVLPAWQCAPGETPGGDEAWPWFARMAARNGLTLNSVHAARNSTASELFNCDVLPKQVSRGVLARNSAYVLGDGLALSAIENDTTHYCRRVDRFNLCTFDPARAVLSRTLGNKILPLYVLGTEFRADRPPPRSMFITGLDLRPFPAVWTVGKRAALYIRPVLPQTGDLRLDMQFATHGALLTPRHPAQHAIVSVDGRRIGILTFILGGANGKRSLVIPRRLVSEGHVVEIGFRLPDAVTPRELGINGDGRLLGLYVSRIRVVPDT